MARSEVNPFIGRERELQVLAHAWQEPRSAFIPIYGRRRVGKSEQQKITRSSNSPFSLPSGKVRIKIKPSADHC